METKKLECECGENKNLIGTLTEITSSVVKLAQDKLIERIEQSIDRLTRNLIFSFIIAFLSLIGIVFILVGFSMWIGTITNLGLWFGFLFVGFLFSLLAVFVVFLKKIMK